MSGLLAGKRLLVTGVLNRHSIAFAAAQAAQEHGAEIVLTSFGKAHRLTDRAAKELDPVPDVLELDVTQDEHWAEVGAELRRRWGGLDGALHAIAFAPPSCMGGGMLDVPWDDVAVAVRISAYSLQSLAAMARPLMAESGGGSLIGLDYDATVAWPDYDWMGVAKAALESTSRYLARDLGPDNIRVNLVACGPIGSTAARSIPGFKQYNHVWGLRAPLGWDVFDATPVGRTCVALWSDLMTATTGEIVHADGGAHAIGRSREEHAGAAALVPGGAAGGGA
jgi:enoyl-[acyl-carrier protein] reductase I